MATPASYDSSQFVPIHLKDCRVTCDFWVGRVRAVRDGALPAIYQQMKETGRWDNLKLQWREGDPNKPHRFWDSDVAKWLEAACYSLIEHPDPALARLVEEAVDLFRGAQQEDGYLNSYYTVVEPGRRWTNVAWSHEMYCAGHLLEAALAHHEYTHSMRLLGPALKYIEHIRSVFGPGEDQKHGYPGHQCLELALLRAYETTHDPSLLDLAQYFIEERGQKRAYRDDSEAWQKHYYDIEAEARGEDAFVGPMRRGGDRFEYMQADKPIREMTKEGIRGHSVRAMYWLTAVAGLARLTKGEDGTLKAVAEALWANTTERKMHVTGGLGAIGEWEGFGPDYFLPNETSYLETCAAIGLVFFARQMLLLDPLNCKYAEVMERALYNGVLVGMSLDGKGFFYDNPLATLEGAVKRSEWFQVACCPPNVSRLLGSLGKYIYSITSRHVVYVHLYVSSTVEIKTRSGRVVVLQQESDPWSGSSSFTLTGSAEDVGKFKLCLRKPVGVDTWKVSAGDDAQLIYSGSESVAKLDLGDHAGPSQTSLTVLVQYAYHPRVIHPHHLDFENRGCVALARGPFIYCLESIDNPAVSDLRALRLPLDGGIEEHMDSEKFKEWKLDVPVLNVLGTAVERQGAGERKMYLNFVPYFAWANRGKGNTRVWFPVE